jgi:hypothetical protein
VRLEMLVYQSLCFLLKTGVGLNQGHQSPMTLVLLALQA